MSSIIFFNTIIFISGFISGQLFCNIHPNITILPIQTVDKNEIYEEDPPPFNEEHDTLKK